MSIRETNLLKNIDQKKLKEAIDYYCQYRTVEKEDASIPGSPFELWVPNYETKAIECLQIMPMDKNYDKNYNIRCIDVLPTSMSARQIRTLFSYIIGNETNANALLANRIEDGTILKCLLRLDDLLKTIEK